MIEFDLHYLNLRAKEMQDERERDRLAEIARAGKQRRPILAPFMTYVGEWLLSRGTILKARYADERPDPRVAGWIEPV